MGHRYSKDTQGAYTSIYFPYSHKCQPFSHQIRKSYALSEYQLDYANLDDLSYDVEKYVLSWAFGLMLTFLSTSCSSGVGKMHMYKEYEVEWVAWKVHGGPDRLWYL